MIEERNLICHIGFPKTGSTYLQKKIFPKLTDIHYIPWNQDLIEALYRIIQYDDSFYKSEYCKKIIQSYLSKQSNLISYEPLTGSHQYSRFSNRTQIANRLKEVGVSKVIITIRNQFDVLNSSYKEYIKRGGVMKFDQYIGINPLNSRSMFDFAYFDYYSIYKLYISIFGVENVLLLQYENMNSDSYLNKLNSFLENSEIRDFDTGRLNESISVLKTNILRMINHVTYNSYRPSHLISNRISTAFFYNLLKKLPNCGSKTFIEIEHQRKIENYYRQSNLKLQEYSGIDLTQLYPK